TYSSTVGNGLYSIDWVSTNSVPSLTVGVEGYFIQNSILGLHKAQNGGLDSQQILIRDSSFVYDQGVWRGSIVGGTLSGGLDIGSIVAKFLAAPKNPNAANTNQQQLIVAAMKDYMDKYEAWAATTPPFNKSDPSYSAAKSAQ